LPAGYVAQLWAGAFAGSVLGWGIRLALPRLHPIIVAVLVLVPYGLLYFAVTSALGVPESVATVRRALRMAGIRN
jgi:putative peptidoglycan lipid II flippase